MINYSEYKLKKTLIDTHHLVASRRHFLRQIAGGAALLALGGPEMASAAVRHLYSPTRPHPPTHKIIALENINTGDKLKLAYFEQGRYVKEALQEINYLFRDFHSGDVHPIDPTLLDQLYDLKQNLGVTRPVHIISGYRSPFTNAQLRKQSHKVARHSLHMEGRAIDIRIEGVSTKHIRNAAIAMQRGGVGYYPRSNFVHLDTGKIRVW